MTLLVLSFLAGMLTVLAPCILPLLPVVVGGAVGESRSRLAPLVIIGSLSVSIILFTLLLKASTALISIPQTVWSGISGGILIAFGLLSLFPGMWEKFVLAIGFGAGANRLMAKGYQKKSMTGDIIMGMALGPIFSTCSPTYAVILATVLPQSLALGITYLLVYVIGLALMLLLIAYVGQRVMNKLNVVANPNGIFKRGLGAVFLVLGILIMFGIDKKIETKLLDSGYFNVTSIEQHLLDQQK